MAKFAFINMPAYGHVYHTLPVVQELVKRGQEVIYYLTDEFKELIEATGATFSAYPDVPQSETSEPLQNVLQILESLASEPPDMLIYDYMCPWASLMARKLEIPAVSMRGPFFLNEHFGWGHVHLYRSKTWSPSDARISALQKPYLLHQQMEQSCQKMGIPRSTLPQSATDLYAIHEGLNISFLTRHFQPAVEAFDESYLFVGPPICPRPFQGSFSLDVLDDRPLLYISLGTIFSDRPDIFKACLKAFGNTSWQVLLSRGQKRARYALGPVPANITVANHIPQLEILPRASVFITHTGSNSMMESIFYGVPMVAIPQFPEQAIHADNMAKLGLGVALNPDTITADILREAVEQVSSNQEFAERCRAMQAEVQEAGGYRLAVDAIMQYALSNEE